MKLPNEALIWKEMLTLLREIVRPEVFREYGFSRTEFDILAQLFVIGRPVTQTGLLRSLLTTKGNVSQMLARLEERGLVERETSDEDRRYQTVSLTGKGRETIGPLVTDHIQYIKGFFDCLTDLEKEILLKILQKVGSNLNE